MQKFRVTERRCYLCGTDAKDCILHNLPLFELKEICARCHRPGPTIQVDIAEESCWVCDDEGCAGRLRERQEEHRREIRQRIMAGRKRGDTHLIVVQDPISAATDTPNFYVRVAAGQSVQAALQTVLESYHADARYLECTVLEIQ